MASTVDRARLARRVLRATWELRVLLEPRVQRALPESGQPVLPVRQEPQDQRGRKDWMVSKVLRALPVRQGRREQLGLRVLRERLEPLEQQALERQVQPVLLAIPGLPVLRVWMDSMVLVVLRGPLAFKAPQVRPEPREQQARLEPRVLGRQGLQALRVVLVLLVLQALRDLTD